MNTTNICLISLVLNAFFVNATVLTVSNHPGNPAQYQNIPDAISAAQAGDTIYIHGSETSYGDFTLDRRLVFIGPGHNPNKQNALTVQIGQIQNPFTSSNLTENGSAFIGLTIVTIDLRRISDVIIERCHVNTIVARPNTLTNTYSSNWLITGNIITNIHYDYASHPANFVITNNIISGVVSYIASSLISNNLFLGLQSSNEVAFFSCTNNTLQNNIFFGRSPEGTVNSTFNNNISFANKATAIPYGTNYGVDNLVDVNPMFMNFPEGGGYFAYGYDFRLQPSSPGNGAGTDGDEIGVYGGLGFSVTGEPPIPQIREFIIKNSVVAPGGKISILIKAGANN